MSAPGLAITADLRKPVTHYEPLPKLSVWKGQQSSPDFHEYRMEYQHQRILGCLPVALLHTIHADQSSQHIRLGWQRESRRSLPLIHRCAAQYPSPAGANVLEELLEQQLRQLQRAIAHSTQKQFGGHFHAGHPM